LLWLEAQTLSSVMSAIKKRCCSYVHGLLSEFLRQALHTSGPCSTEEHRLPARERKSESVSVAPARVICVCVSLSVGAESSLHDTSTRVQT
jgi:hypothetical protein